MKKIKFVLLFIFLLVKVLNVFSQTEIEIKNNYEYCWGSGEGNTLTDAEKNAIQSMSRAIISQNKSKGTRSSTQKREITIFDNTRSDNIEYNEEINLINIVSTSVVLCNIHRIITQNNNKYNVFCYVKRQDLIDYYTANINTKLQGFEGFLNLNSNWQSSTEKVKAIRKCNDTTTINNLLREIDYYQKLLIAVSPNEPEKLQQNRHQTQIERLKNIKKQKITVFISGEEILLGDTLALIANKIPAKLAENDFVCVKNSADADFTLEIKANTYENGTVSRTSALSYETVVVIKFSDNKTNNIIYKNILTETGSNLAVNAKVANKYFGDIATKIQNQILSNIQN